MSDTAARVLTIIGIVFNGIVVVLLGLLVFLSVILMGWFSWMPFIGWAFWELLLITLGSFLLALVIGMIIPIYAYRKINPGSKTSAAVILIICGVIDLLIVSLIGGVLLLVGGIIVAVWKPYEHEEYRPHPAKPPVHYPPSTTPAPRPVTTTPEPGISEEQAFCTYCGSKFLGGEKFCPSCGASIEKS